jgi:glycosyltransferase involved in cell wall biosynthesis
MKAPKLLFVVTEDWYFISHRLPLAIAAKAAGFDVVVAAREGPQAYLIHESGIRFIPFELSRRGGNPLAEVIALWRLYRTESPDIVHHVALKPVMFGAIAALLARVPAQVNAITGLGWLFSSTNSIVRLIRPTLRWILGRLLAQRNALTIVQNPEDLDFLMHSGLPVKHLRLVRGAGVDIKIFNVAAQPPEPVCIMMVSRMLWSKGVGEFVEAAQYLANKGLKARFVLIGDPDPANPAAVPESVLRGWHGQNGVEWWGRRGDIPEILRTAHIACLPSYREGLPKSLLEAAACGLPIVTTDTPGCREVVAHGLNGLLVPVGDSKALADALGKLISDADLRQRLGEQSRIRAVTEYSLETVIRETLAIYQEVLV